VDEKTEGKGMMDNCKAKFEERKPAHKGIREFLFTFDKIKIRCRHFLTVSNFYSPVYVTG
jgi:hypothetical protein